jgi:hypothetical protein
MVNILTRSMRAISVPRKAVIAAYLLLIHSALAISEPSPDEPLLVRHYQVQERYEFGAKLLALSLSKSGHAYQIQAPEAQLVNERRGDSMIINGSLDVLWQSVTKKRESKMTPIHTPIYRGILGLRLILAKHDKAYALSQIRTKEDLSRYMGGHGAHWGDLPVYAANNLPVKTHVDYNLLFKWLTIGRIDYFQRGINEIWSEQQRYAKDLTVVNEVMLFYPHPVYFYVSKQRPKLAKDIAAGLRVALEDGSYKTLFLEEYQSILNKSNLMNRHLVILNNPAAPSMKAKDMEWWLPASKLNRPLVK